MNKTLEEMIKEATKGIKFSPLDNLMWIIIKYPLNCIGFVFYFWYLVIKTIGNFCLSVYEYIDDIGDDLYYTYWRLKDRFKKVK